MGGWAYDSMPRVNLSNEYGSIGEKVGRKWLTQKGYEVHSFQEIMFKTDILDNMQRRKGNTERGHEMAKCLADFLGDRLEDMKEYIKGIRELAKQEFEVRLARHYSRVGIAPDLVVKKDGKLFFVEIKVNESEPKPFQRASFRIAEEHGFKTMMLRLSVKIDVQSNVQLIEP